MHPQLSSPFFLLPYEIRLAIYEFYLLPSNQPTYYLCTPTPLETFLARGPFRRDNIPALVLACKRLHAELRALVFDTVTFVVRHSYHHGKAALGSFGLLDLPRIKKLVYVAERTTESGWRDHSPVFLRLQEGNAWWWFHGALGRLASRNNAYRALDFRGAGRVPALTGLKEVVFFWGPSTLWYDERAGWLDIFQGSGGEDGGQDGELSFRLALPMCPLLDHLARLRGLETIRLGGYYQDWWVPYLEERTKARILVEGPPGPDVFSGIGLP